jgi:hypothetical protein
MTTTDFEQGLLTGIHAVYEDGPYDVGLFGAHFVSLKDAWDACLALASRSSAPWDPVPAHDALTRIDYAYELTLVAALGLLAETAQSPRTDSALARWWAAYGSRHPATSHRQGRAVGGCRTLHVRSAVRP